MTLFVEKGTITAPASTGNQTLSFAADSDPKAIQLWTTGQTADARLNADGRFSLGFGTYRGATVQHNYQTIHSVDNGASSATAKGMGAGSILKLFSNNTPTVVLNVALVSMSIGVTSEVVLNFVTTLSGAVIHYLVLGGDDITDAQAGTFVPTTAVATQDVTIATGFGQPDLMFFHTNASGGTDQGTSSARNGFGVAKSATERWFTTFTDVSASATMTCGGYQKNRAILHTSATSTIDAEMDLDARANWPVDGFRIAYTTQEATAALQDCYLALKGTFTSTIGDTTIPTAVAPQTQNLTHSGTPVGAVFVNWPGPKQTTLVEVADADLGGFMLGATDGTNEGFAGWTQDDGNLTAATGVVHPTTKAFQGITADSTVANPPILNSECDASIAGSNLVLNWTDTDTIARAFGYVLLGSNVDSTTHYQSVPFMGGH